MVSDLLTRPTKRTAPHLVAMLVLGGALAWLVVPPAPPEPARGPAPQVVVAGVSIDTRDGERALRDARAAVRAYLRGKVKVTAPGGDVREATRADLGAQLDPQRLTMLLAQARDPSSAMRRRHGRGAIVLPIPVEVAERTALSALMQMKDELDREPVESRFDAQSHAMKKEQAGVRVDVDATLARLRQALVDGGDRVEAVAEALAPKRSVADKNKDVQTSDVLGYFETKYVPDRKHEARTFNLKLAASKLDGYVVLPGETFDFNEVVGPRSEAYGYKPAPVIAEGELADGVGGGTCQIAGTLHAAALFAGLTIVERHPHTRPSYYIKMGLDAAVAYPTMSLRFKNDLGAPIVLHESVAGGTVRAEILGPKRTRDTSFVRVIADAIPFAERDVDDPKIPRGKRVLAQRGIPGFHVQRWRIVRENSVVLGVDQGEDKYPATAQIWHVGTGPWIAGWEPSDDQHPEYVGDEYLHMMQGPPFGTSCASQFDPACTTPVSTPGGGAIEVRQAGRFGTYGWTRRFQNSQASRDRATPSG